MEMAEDPRLVRLRELFDGWARAGRADGMERGHGPAARMAFDRLPLERDAWYLDIGCGNGYTVRWAAEKAPEGWAVGIDLSPEMISLARSLSSELPNVQFQVASFPDTRLPHGCFDAVLSMEALYYLPDLPGALQEIARLLVPGGSFACIVDYYRENPASHDWPRDLGVPMTLLDEAGWREALEEAGLEISEQTRLRLPPDLASQPWKTTEGSLLTVGVRRDRR